MFIVAPPAAFAMLLPCRHGAMLLSIFHDTLMRRYADAFIDLSLLRDSAAP